MAIDAIRLGRLTGTWDTDALATGSALIWAMRDIIENGSSDDIVVQATYVDASNVADHPGRDYTVDDFPMVDAGLTPHPDRRRGHQPCAASLCARTYR